MNGVHAAMLQGGVFAEQLEGDNEGVEWERESVNRVCGARRVSAVLNLLSQGASRQRRDANMMLSLS